MTDRSRGSVAGGFRFAFAIIALTTLGVSSHAAAAQSGTPRPTVEAAKLSFDANVSSTRPASRAHIDIDPIDPSVRHRWPYLSDTGSADTMQHSKS